MGPAARTSIERSLNAAQLSSPRPMIVELSHVIRDRMATYPGLPPVRVDEYMGHEASRARYAPGTTFHIGRIDMVENTGTYVDVPYHRDPDGDDLEIVPLERLVDLPGLLVHAPEGQRVIGPELFSGLELAGRALLIRTGWSKRWGRNQYFVGHPHLNAAAGELLAGSGVSLVGIDSLNIDATDGPERPVHTALLRAYVPIVEHLSRLDQLPPTGFRFFAAPPRVAGMGSFPVRAFALVP